MHSKVKLHLLGSLPLPEDEKSPPPDPRVQELREKGLEWEAKRLEARLEPPPPYVDVAITALKRARAEAATAADWVQDTYFRDWAVRCVVAAKTPAEWTQARVLYEDYLWNARFYGKDRVEKTALTVALATETQWGRMMARLFPTKKRRSTGWFYPLQLQRKGRKARK